MRVLFVFFNRPPTPFNTSVAALCAVVRDAGHERVALSVSLDDPVERSAERVAAIGGDVVAVSAMSRDWPIARALLRALPRGAFRVVGGYHASLAPREVAACEAVDAVCVGDGERPLRAILDGVPRASIPGLWVRGERGWSADPPPADPVLDIAALPRWDYDVFGGLDAIVDRGVNTFGPLVDRFLPTRASRGCPYRCAYCSAPTWGQVAGFAAGSARNVRPVEHLCDELAGLRERGALDGFEFWDEHFPVDLAWLESFAEVYPRRVGLPFKVEMHPSAANRRRLALLAEAGCALFHCGVESGDPALRRETLNRRTSDDVLAQVFADARDLGIETSASVMTGLPGETYAQALATVELLRRLAPDSFMWSSFMTLPRTVLGERLRDQAGSISSMSDAERDAVHAELEALRGGMVERAGVGRARPVAVPRPMVATVAMPSEPSGEEPPEELEFAAAVATSLGLRGPSSALVPAFRVVSARWSGRELLIEIESSEVAARTITIAPVDGTPGYLISGGFRFAHRGAAAPAQVLSELRRLGAELDAAKWSALIALHPR